MFPISDPGLQSRRFPIVNVLLIAVSILVFLYELTLGDLALTKFYNNYGVVPYELTGQGDISEQIQEFKDTGDQSVLEIEGVEGMLARAAPRNVFGLPIIRTRDDIKDVYEGGPPSVWLTPFTSMFIHGGWMHLLGNMLFLWVFGDNIEDRLGRIKYLLFYLITGFFATAAQLLVNLDTGIPMIGASGAIAGVLGAYFVLFPTSQIRTVIFFFLITIVALPAYLLIGIWILLQFFNAVVGSLGSDFAGGVAYWAHVGGFVAGFLIVAAFVGVSGVRQLFRRQPW
ncbi:MAG: rhomboid family intramembrane serine protease [Dehalococcoidia bacterium]